MVERVYRAGRFRLSNAASDRCFDVGGFDLDIDDDSASNRGERFRKGWNPRPVSERELFQLRRRELNDGSMRGPLWMSGVDDRVVVNHNYPVAGRVHVELNALGAELDCALKRGYRILGMSLVCPSVGDPLRRLAAWTCSQAFLSVVALCSMSAKQ